MSASSAVKATYNKAIEYVPIKSFAERLSRSKYQLHTFTRARRSFFYVPASNRKFLEKCLTRNADCVILDLEDGVAPNAKEDARKNLREFLDAHKHLAEKGDVREPEIGIRVNHGNKEEYSKDIKFLKEVESPIIKSIICPKVDNDKNYAKHVKRVLEATKQPIERYHFIPLIESAQGTIYLKEILRRNFVPAAVFAAEDFRADLDLPFVKNNWNLQFARSQFVLTCKAAGIQPIDKVCIDYNESSVSDYDESVNTLNDELLNGYETGFEGKQCIHPNQIEPINSTFLPTPEAIDFAVKVDKAWKENTEKGVGAFDVEGKMIDAPVYKHSTKILYKAKAAGIDTNDYDADRDRERRQAALKGSQLG